MFMYAPKLWIHVRFINIWIAWKIIILFGVVFYTICIYIKINIIITTAIHSKYILGIKTMNSWIYSI